MEVNTARVERLRIAAIDAVSRMTDPKGPKIPTMPIAIARDEGGYIMAEAINPWNPVVGDWRFHESDEIEIEWTEFVHDLSDMHGEGQDAEGNIIDGKILVVCKINC